jgi:hypothetical protein
MPKQATNKLKASVRIRTFMEGGGVMGMWRICIQKRPKRVVQVKRVLTLDSKSIARLNNYIDFGLFLKIFDITERFRRN